MSQTMPVVGTQMSANHQGLSNQVADQLVAYLEQIGIEFVFGAPGGAIEPLYNALARSASRGGIRHILARHDAGAAFMADGYARETGKIGVCCADSGPNATNLLTGVACAYDNGVPMLVITGQSEFHSNGYSQVMEDTSTGINVLGMFRHCTHYNSMISNPTQLEPKLIAALQRATRSPRGPVHLAITEDVLRSESSRSKSVYDLRSLLAPSSLMDEAAVQSLMVMIAEAHKVVLLVGGWCGEAIGSILQFATLKGATFVTTRDGRGLVSSYHPLFRGVFGSEGHQSAEEALNDESVDLILAVGTSMGEWGRYTNGNNTLNARLVHIDESEDHLARTPMARHHVRGRILSVFTQIIEQMSANSPDDNYEYGRRIVSEIRLATWLPEKMLNSPEKYVSNATPIKPQRLMGELSRLFPISTRYLASAGSSASWATHYLHPADRRLEERRRCGGERKRGPGRRGSEAGWLRVTTNFAPMGWAIGSAIGTAAANPNVPVVCIAGDGSVLMSGQEISVAVAERQTIIFVVMNDHALSMDKPNEGGHIAYNLPPTDYAMLARAMGAEAHTIRGPLDLARLNIKHICSRKGPTLLDVLVDPNEIPPINVHPSAVEGK